MRALGVVVLALSATLALAERILLVPLDSRPAAGQFAQMIARMAAVEVQMPPYDMLGRYIEPGDSGRVLDWLEAQDYADVSAVVASIDMIAYGGLIASRTADIGFDEAMARVRRLASLRARYPNVKFYAYSAIMRLYPTATRASAAWRVNLGKYAELKERHRRASTNRNRQAMQNLLAKVPALEVARYEEARSRNHDLQRALLRMSKAGTFDYMILGQDDAQPMGPHIPEQAALRIEVDRLGIGGKVYLCEGIDQHANVLVSRALLRRNDWIPRVRIVFSDDAGKLKIANYESKTVQKSLEDQLFASGARPSQREGEYDYTLYVNTPKPGDEPFERFLAVLEDEVDQGFPGAVSDINLGWTGTGDPRLFEDLWKKDRMMRLLSYAGWNTAGNTMGTAIPAANVYLLARRLQVDPAEREIAQKEFLLHRFVNDWAYHKFTRPKAYELIDALPSASREEVGGEAFEAVNRFVQRDLGAHLERYFKDQFLGRRFFAGTEQMEFSGIDLVKVFLPWPRAYEVRLEFKLQAKRVPTGGTALAQRSR